MEFYKPTLSRVSAWSFFIILSSQLFAAEPLFLNHMSFTNLQKKMSISLSKQDVNALRPFQPNFLLLDHHTDKQQIEHIKMQQRYKGFPVFGSYAVFHRKQLAGVTATVTMNGTVYQKLEEDLGDCPPGLIANAPQALNLYKLKFRQEDIVQQAIQPIVFIDERYHAHWAYQIMVYLQPDYALASQPTVIMEEHTGKVLLHWDALNTLHQTVKGVGFGGNHRVGKHQYGKEIPALEIIRDDHLGRCFLMNNHIMVVDMQHHTRRPNLPMSFMCEEDNADKTYWTGYEADGYDRENGGYSVSNDAMYFGELVKKMYRSEYGVEVLKLGHQSMPIIFRVHYSNYFANAFWDGQQMTFGDGDGMLHPLVALSITAHEISHGFTQQHSGLLYYGQAGGINEAFSDMASQAAEFFVYGKPSWYMGADVLKTNGALRWFRHPSRDGISIERATDYQTDMDVHHSSGVYNYLFYLLANHVGWDTKKAFQVMVKANMDYWTPTTNFAEGACGILAATRDLGLPEQDVEDALDEVFIDYDC